jgi:hypothetical protein
MKLGLDYYYDYYDEDIDDHNRHFVLFFQFVIVFGHAILTQEMSTIAILWKTFSKYATGSFELLCTYALQNKCCDFKLIMTVYYESLINILQALYKTSLYSRHFPSFTFSRARIKFSDISFAKTCLGILRSIYEFCGLQLTKPTKILFQYGTCNIKYNNQYIHMYHTAYFIFISMQEVY